MGILRALLNMPKVARWNNDRKQQELALMLISAGRSTAREAVPVALEIRAFISREGWGAAEAADRISHALSMVKVMERRVVFENATEVGLTLARGEM
jgi:hypothetical protein